MKKFSTTSSFALMQSLADFISPPLGFLLLVSLPCSLLLLRLGDGELQTLLNRYLNKKEVAYYMARIRKVAQRFPDTLTQVIMVVQEKEKQPKFMRGTKQYKRNAIIDYVLKENLKEFGWSIEPPSSRKERARDLFETVGQ